ncbi:hypothetical protein NW762_013410 [Fusarium torreyae]|uniref:Ricin B lectin domain-containing protein n=1 Tax=Fusarium torreyae TaxID=1237075 RepID=A0A9W8RKQ6_9HYPO|nr:hypothetical protein NW762_013410 [Fusarium torreyae]
MIDSQSLSGRTVAFVNFGTGTAMDLSGGSKTSQNSPPNGTPCIGYQPHLNESQQWKLVKWKDDDLGVPSSGSRTSWQLGITGWQYSTFGCHQDWYINLVGVFRGNGTVVKPQTCGPNTFVDLRYGSSDNG